MSEFDLAAIYRTARERLVALAPQLSTTQLETIVPTCPAWTVQDVYAHLAGGSTDVDTRDVAAPTSEEQTALQIETRRGHAIGQLTAEWQGNGPAVERMLAARSDSALSIDAWTHDQDIHNALNLVSGRDGEGLELVVNAVWRLKRKLRASGVSSFRIVTERRDWVIGDTAPAATLRVSDYELARANLARRSLNQIRGYEWEGDAATYVPMIPVWAPPEHDIVE